MEQSARSFEPFEHFPLNSRTLFFIKRNISPEHQTEHQSTKRHDKLFRVEIESKDFEA